MNHRLRASFLATIVGSSTVTPLLGAFLIGFVLVGCAGCCQPMGCMSNDCGSGCIGCCATDVGCSRRLRDFFGPPAAPVVENEQATFVTESKYHPVPTRPVFARRESIVFSGEEGHDPRQTPSMESIIEGPALGGPLDAVRPEPVPMETDLLAPRVPGPPDSSPVPGVMGPMQRAPLLEPEEDVEVIGPGDSALPEEDDVREEAPERMPTPTRRLPGAASVRPPVLSFNVLRGAQRPSSRRGSIQQASVRY